MDTYFAPGERAEEEELAAEIEIVNMNPVLDGLLHSVSGLLAVLNEHRQIVSLNDSFMQMLGIHDPEEALGLWQGEVLQCIHAHEEPAGCGTTKFCSTCGAAIAIVTSLDHDKPAEKMCALTVNRGDKTVDIALLVKSHPIKIDGTKFLLLFLQDITQEQQRAALERTFFHDINNILTVLVAASDLLFEDNQSSLVKTIHQASSRLAKEVNIQQCLMKSESSAYQPLWYEITTKEILEELQSFFVNHPVRQNKVLEISASYPMLSIKTDISLLQRVLCNMITNAFEATDEKSTVQVWLEHKDTSVVFFVQNSQAIPEDIARRVFQRNFSTKAERGRGVGTFSMKLFGEEILGGQVSFTSSREEGTVFRFSVPLQS